MTNLERKLDLIMRYIAAENIDEQYRLRDEIRNAISSEDPIDIPTAANDELMSDIIDDLFRELGAPCHLLGYDRAAYAIKMVISDNKCLREITKRLYPDVAEHFDTTPSRVERSIRHLVDVAWTRHDTMNVYRIFGDTVDLSKGKPTNAEFIAACAKIVKRRMRNSTK